MALLHLTTLDDSHNSPMDMYQQFKDSIASVIGSQIGDAEIHVPFTTLGLDPLTVLEVIDRVTDRTGILFPASLFRDCDTLSDIKKKLSKKSNNEFAALSSSIATLNSLLVQKSIFDVSHLGKHFAEEASSAHFWTEVYSAQKQLVLSYITTAFTALGSSLDNIESGEVLLPPRGIWAKHHRLVDGAIFDILQDGGLIDRRGNTFVRASAPVDKTQSQLIYTKLLHDHPPYANIHRLLNVTGSKLAQCLTGAEDPIKLLFGKHKDLLQDFYTNSPMSVTASKNLAALLRHIFSAQAPMDVGCVEILEVGAGLGGTTRFVLDALIGAGIPFKYIFTDISHSFLTAAKSRYMDRLPAGSSMEYLVLDIEKAPLDKLRGRFHVVISTNCIHATKNLVLSCMNVRKMLRPGGFFALIEFTTRLFWLDLVFGLLDGWWLFDDGRKHCTVNEAHWKTSLQTAGFGDVFCTGGEGDEKPNPQLIVACT